MNESDPHRPNVYDGIESTGDVPAAGTPVEVVLEARAVDRLDQLRESVEHGELGEIAKGFVDEYKGALGFQFKGPRKVSMFIAEHSHGITKAIVTGAVGAAGVGLAAAIVLYEHHKGKSE